MTTESLRRRAELHLRARRPHRQNHSLPSAQTAASTSGKVWAAIQPNCRSFSPAPESSTKTCSSSADGTPKLCPPRPPTSAPTTFAPATCVGAFTPFRAPANSATTPGPKTPGPIPAPPTTGPAWRSTRRAALLYAPTGSAASDFYGADRLGDNLFANCLLALARRHRRTDLALSSRKARSLGPRFSLPSQPCHGHSRRQQGRRGRADYQAGLGLSVRSNHRQAAFSHRVPRLPGQRRARGIASKTQPLTGEARAVRPPVAHRRHAYQTHAGSPPVGARAVSFFSQRGTVRPVERRQGNRSYFLVTTAAPNGAARPSIPRRVSSMSTPTISHGPDVWPKPAPAIPAVSVYLANCATCHGDDLSRRASADSRARLISTGKRTAQRSRPSSGRARVACPPSRLASTPESTPSFSSC